MHAATIPSVSPLIETKPGGEAAFARNYERAPFSLRHNLAGHEAFSMPNLFRLVRRMAEKPEHLYYNVGDPAIGSGWDFQPGRPFPAEEAFERIETANAWMILKSVQVEPEYNEILEQFFREAYALSGRDLERETFNHLFAIIISSPRRVTPYHMDGESNYLLQVRGNKTIYVFNGSDRAVVTDEELEKFWCGDLNAATYKEKYQDQTPHFDLTPGDGVHVPVTYPHWVKNGDSASVSLGLTVQFRDRTLPELYRFNGSLRRRGLKPRPPGQSRLADMAKLTAMRLGHRSAISR